MPDITSRYNRVNAGMINKQKYNIDVGNNSWETIKYKFYCSQDYLTCNVGFYFFLNEYNSTVNWDMNYNFEIRYIDNIEC